MQIYFGFALLDFGTIGDSELKCGSFVTLRICCSNLFKISRAFVKILQMVYAEEIDKKGIGESIIVKNGGIFYLI